MDQLEEDGHHQSRRTLIAASASLLLLLLWIAQIYLSSSALPSHSSLASRMSVTNILTHLNAFESIAQQHGNSRSIANGYAASAEYVLQTLRSQTDQYEIWVQPFVAITYTETAAPTLSQVFPDDPSSSPIPFILNTDFRQPRYGGNGTYTLTNATVSIVNGNGCELADYTQSAQCVAVVANTADCDLYTKAILAEDAGAVALFVYSRSLLSTRVRTVDWKDGDRVVQIPVLSVTTTVKNVLVSQGVTAYVNVNVSSVVQTHATLNVLAETKGGDKTAVVFPGAHLDSVAAGPGINDNGSGSATLLEMALQLNSIASHTHNAVRFAWWGAEEEGLLGSYHYVRSLTSQERDKIAVYINHDMLASPNYILLVKNATDAPSVLAGGIVVQGMFEEYYTSHALPYRMDQMRSGSDFLPFVSNNITSAALAAGAGTIKTANERTLYSGLANAPLDPCYHEACDTVANVDTQCLSDISQASSTVVWDLATNAKLRQTLLLPPLGQ